MNDTGQIVLLITTILGFALQAWRETRNRAWAQEDRRQANEEIIALAEARAAALLIETDAKMRAHRIQNRVEQQKHTDTLRTDISEVKAVAVQAFQEANQYNTKIADLNQRLLDQGAKDILNGNAEPV